MTATATDSAQRDPYKPRFGQLRIRPRPRGLFQTEPDGTLALVTGVVDRDGEFVDLVAWGTEDPSAWWLKYGGQVLLGAPGLAVAQYHGKAVRLHSTPMGWLRAALAHANAIADGRYPASPYAGFAVLNWKMPLQECVEGTGAIQCDSPALLRRLKTSLRQWEPRLSTFSEGARGERRNAA